MRPIQEDIKNIVSTLRSHGIEAVVAGGVNEIPEDVEAQAVAAFLQAKRGGASAVNSIARAILAERHRCASVARQYISDVGFPKPYATKIAELIEVGQ